MEGRHHFYALLRLPSAVPFSLTLHLLTHLLQLFILQSQALAFARHCCGHLSIHNSSCARKTVGLFLHNSFLCTTFMVCLAQQRPECPVRVCCSSSHIVGLGMRGECPHGLKCWLYFPEDDCPFYRTTVFSHYAKNNCPADGVKLKTVCMVSYVTEQTLAMKGSTASFPVCFILGAVRSFMV